MISASRTAYLSHAATIAVACLLIGATANARAGERTDSAGVLVSYRDLNLTTEQGAATLHARIAAAARQVCLVDDVDSRDLAARAVVEQCERQAIARAVHAINSPGLAAAFAARQHQG